MSKSISYQNYLIDSLKDPEEAAGYLNAALEGGEIEVFLLALQNVVKAQGGFAKTASHLKKSRTSLYKSLTKNGNPYLKNIHDILLNLNMRLIISAKKNRKKTI